MSWVGPGGRYTDAEAVAAANGWREHHAVRRLTPEPAAGATWVSYLSLTTAALAGGASYSISTALQVGGTLAAAGTDVETQLIIGGVPVLGPLAEFGVTQGRFIDAGVLTLPLPPGAITIVQQFRHPGGPGSLEALQGNIQIWRER